MAIRKTGMRRILVDGVDYLWKFPRHPSDNAWGCWGEKGERGQGKTGRENGDIARIDRCPTLGKRGHRENGDIARIDRCPTLFSTCDTCRFALCPRLSCPRLSCSRYVPVCPVFSRPVPFSRPKALSLRQDRAMSPFSGSFFRPLKVIISPTSSCPWAGMALVSPSFLGQVGRAFPEDGPVGGSRSMKGHALSRRRARRLGPV
jgi:hypothetical protein